MGSTVNNEGSTVNSGCYRLQRECDIFVVLRFLVLCSHLTKEIVFDMRKNKNSKEPVIINNTSVALIQSYK